MSLRKKVKSFLDQLVANDPDPEVAIPITELYKSLDRRQKGVYHEWKVLTQGIYPNTNSYAVVTMALEKRIHELEQEIKRLTDGQNEPNAS